MSEPQTFTYKRTGHVELCADIYSANAANAAVVLFLHGGALIWGSRQNLGPVFLEPLLDDGYAVVSVDYRLAPATKLPEILGDVRDALTWIQNGCGGSVSTDPSRIAVFGTSAGGYLALSSGTFANRPKAIVSFYGYGSITEAWYTRPSEHYLKHASVTDTEFRRWIDSSEEIASAAFDRFPFYVYTRQRASWIDLVCADKVCTSAQYCPVEHVDKSYPPTFLAHGTVDTDVPYSSSERMYRTLQERSVPSYLHLLEGYGHAFDRNDKDSEVQNVIRNMRRFLSEQL